MSISEVDRLERVEAAADRLRSRARQLPYGELDRKIMHETADLLDELKPLLKSKPKRKKKNAKS